VRIASISYQHRIQLRRSKAFAKTIKFDPAQMKALDEALAPGMISGKRCAGWTIAAIDR
jgi:hypothetical protein